MWLALFANSLDTTDVDAFTLSLIIFCHCCKTYISLKGWAFHSELWFGWNDYFSSSSLLFSVRGSVHSFWYDATVVFLLQVCKPVQEAQMWKGGWGWRFKLSLAKLWTALHVRHEFNFPALVPTSINTKRPSANPRLCAVEVWRHSCGRVSFRRSLRRKKPNIWVYDRSVVGWRTSLCSQSAGQKVQLEAEVIQSGGVSSTADILAWCREVRNFITLEECYHHINQSEHGIHCRHRQ